MSEPRLAIKLRDGTVVAVSAYPIGRGQQGSGFVRVPRSVLDSEELRGPKALGRYVIDLIEADHVRRMTRRPHLSTETWRRILVRFGFRCAYCGAVGVPLQKEHVVPYSKGGPTDESNIVPACQPCNSKKRDQVWEVVWP